MPFVTSKNPPPTSLSKSITTHSLTLILKLNSYFDHSQGYPVAARLRYDMALRESGQNIRYAFTFGHRTGPRAGSLLKGMPFLCMNWKTLHAHPGVPQATSFKCTLEIHGSSLTTSQMTTGR